LGITGHLFAYQTSFDVYLILPALDMCVVSVNRMLIVRSRTKSVSWRWLTKRALRQHFETVLRAVGTLLVENAVFFI
jgi:hypothetical protein